MQTQTYKTVGHHEILADIYPIPDSEDGQKRPAVMFIHGGGLIMGHRKMILPSHIELFHQGGFHVVSIDYRLAPETKLPQIAEDIQDAWRWLQNASDQLHIDADRIAVVGHSAGAFLTLQSGFKLAPRPAALVSMAGYGTLLHSGFTEASSFYNDHYETAVEEEARGSTNQGTLSASGPNDSMQRYTGRGLFYLYCRQQGIWLKEISGHSTADPSWFTQFEPIHHITKAYLPTLLLHGEPDTDIPHEHSVLMQQALAQHQVPHQFISDPNWSHVFPYIPNNPSTDSAFEKMIRFLQQHV